MSVDSVAGRSPLLVVIGGRSARIVHGSDLPKGSDILVLDTDSRTERSFGEMNVVTVGARLVKGEGSGGNMNLARACFRMDMERIAPMVLGRPLVLVLATTDGATGIAGAVELSSLLVKVGSPSFTFLLHEEGFQGSGVDPLRIASVLLDGPLRPGCILTGGSVQSSSPEDPFGLDRVIPHLLRASSAEEGFPAPQMAWLALRDDGGPFEVGPIELPNAPGRLDISPPALVSLLVPEGMTNAEIRSRIGSAFGDPEGVHFALFPAPGTERLHGAYIARSNRRPNFPEGPPPDPETLKEVLGDPVSLEIGPDIKIM
ncbi:MAG: hypothetical protein ACMUHU_01470 [Thermoplasmatota archaeon]